METISMDVRAIRFSSDASNGSFKSKVCELNVGFLSLLSNGRYIAQHACSVLIYLHGGCFKTV